MITEQLNQDIKQAMLDKSPVKLEALRSLKAAFVKAKTSSERRFATEELSDDEEVAVVRKAIKQRKESIDIYRGQSREDLAGVEEAELFFIEKYLPAEISEETLRSVVATVILEVQTQIQGVATMRNMKDVIAGVKIRTGDAADPGLIAKIAKELLSK